MKLLLCYPANDLQLAQISRAAAGLEIELADPLRIDGQLSESDVYCGHARVPVDWERIVSRGRLRWIQSSAAGLDHCLTPPVLASDIVVSSCSGLFRDSVAEQTMALLYGLIRSLPVFFRAMRERDFTRRPTADLHGKTVGLVGFGANGQRVAELLMPVAGRILATDRLAHLWKQEPGLPLIDRLTGPGGLEDLLASSEVVILTLPLDDSTRNLIGAPQLATMPRGSWLVNVGRGGLVDEEALVASLHSGHLAGAGLDVTAIEPLPPESPLWDEPGVLITPHTGAQSARRYQRVTDLLCENLKRYSAGLPLLNRVDKSLGVPLPADRAPYHR